MNTGEDEPSSGLNGRLRPRKSNGPSSQTKATRKTEGKLAQDKPKRTSTPSKATPIKPDDLAHKSETTPTTPQFLCPYCDRKFASKQTLSKHARRLHLSTSKQDSFIGCLFCNHTEAEASGDIVRHMVDSHPNQYFACLDCHTRFPSTSDLAEHKLNVCEKQKPYRSKLRQKGPTGSKKSQKKLNIDAKDEYTDKGFTDGNGFNGIVISCELKPSQVHDGADIEDNITTNLILPPSKTLGSNSVIEKNAVIVLDDIQWNKRIPPNFSFHNTDADQILSRLGVVHRSPRAGESTRRDWFRTIDESTQKFEKCFDTNFYSRVASNVQENLSKFLDGSFNFNPDPDNTIKTRKSKNNVVINTAEGFPILLAYEQYSRNVFDGYMPRAIAPKHKWKWDTIENEKNFFSSGQIKRDSHTNNCIISLVSSLDIWTQLCMRRKFEDKYSILPIGKKTEKLNTIGKELKEILESREIPTSSSQLVRHTGKPDQTRYGIEFPTNLGLVPSTPGYDVQPAVLSGEWVRPRSYVCCACGAQTRDSRALSSHISTQHPNAQVQHYEIVGEPLLNADILKHLYVPPSQVYSRSRPLRGFRDCTKCKKSIALEDLHQHMLDCAGDTPAVRRKCRYRPFGVRRRRPRLPDNTIRKKMRKDLRTRHRQKNHMRCRPRIRSEVGDAETIRKMIADLPAKRHRAIVNPQSGRKNDHRRNKSRSSEDPKNRRIRSAKEPNYSKSLDPVYKDDFNVTSGDDDDNKTLKPNIKPSYRDNVNKTLNEDDDDNKALKPKTNPVNRDVNDASKRVDDKNKTLETNRQTNINESSKERADDSKSLKPKLNRLQDENVRHSSIERNTILRVNRKSEIECPNVDEIQPNESDSTDQNQDLPNNNAPEMIDVNSGDFRGREHSDRDGSDNRNEQPGGSRQDGNENNNNNPPAPNIPLKHSIASLTRDLDTHDKSVQFHQMLFLLQQEGNKESATSEHGPSGQQQLFENDVMVPRLDKPPLLNELPTPDSSNANQNNNKLLINKPRKGLNDCIAMLRNKRGDPIPRPPDTNLVPAHCGNNEPLELDPRYYLYRCTIDSKIDPKPAEVFSRSVIPPEIPVEPRLNEIVPHQILFEQTTPKSDTIHENVFTSPKCSARERNKKSLLMPYVSTPQKEKGVPIKRKYTRTRSNARAKTEMQNLFHLPAQLEIIPQRSDVGAKTPTARKRRDSLTKVLVSPETDAKKQTKQRNKNDEPLQIQPLEMYSEPKTYDLRGNRVPDQNLLSAVQRSMTLQGSLSDQRQSSEQKALSKHLSHLDTRGQIDQRSEQELCLEQWAQSLFVDPRTHCEQRQYSDLMAYGEQRSYVDRSYSENRAYSDQRQYADLRLLAEQRQIPERRSIIEQQPHTEVRPRSDHRLQIEQRAYLEQMSLTDQRALIAHGLQINQWPLTEQWPRVEQRRHNEHTEQRPTEPQASVEKRKTDHRALEARSHTEQRSHTDQRAHSDQRAFMEEMSLYEHIALSERQAIERRKSIEQTQSEKRLSSEQKLNSEHKSLAEQPPFMEPRSLSEQKSLMEHRTYNEIQPYDLSTQEENEALRDQISLATQKMLNENKQMNEHKTQQNDQRAYERVLNENRFSNEYRSLQELRSPNENRSLKEQIPLNEHNSENELRVSERRTSNEYRSSREQRSTMDEVSLTEQKYVYETKTLNKQKTQNDPLSLNEKRLCSERKSTSKSPLAEENSSTRTTSPTNKLPAVNEMKFNDQAVIEQPIPETFSENHNARTESMDLYPENNLVQPTTIENFPQREIQNNVIERAYSENGYSEIPSDGPLPQESTNAEPIMPAPLDLSGKMPFERSKDLSNHDNSLITNTYDSYETLDLSKQNFGRQIYEKDVNMSDGVVDLRIKSTSQSGFQEGSINLSAVVSNNDIDIVTDLSYRRCDDNYMPTDLSVRRNISVDDDVGTVRYDVEPVIYDVAQTTYDVEPAIYDVQDLSSHKLNFTEEMDRSNVPTTSAIRGSVENISAEEPTDLSGTRTNISDYPVVTEAPGTPGIDTKESYISIDLTEDDDGPTIAITKSENDQQDVTTTDPKTALLQPALKYLSGETQTGIELKELKSNEVINAQKSEQSALLLKTPVVVKDPTINIPQHKMGEATPSLVDSADVLLQSPSTRPLICQPVTSFANPLKSSSDNASDTSINTQNVIPDRFPYGFTGSSLNAVNNMRSLPVYTLPNLVMTTIFNKYESTTPVYTLANACISVTKIESSSADTLTNSLLSNAGATVAKTTSVYTLAGTTIGAPMNYNVAPPGQAPGGNPIYKENNSDPEVKAVEKSTIKINNVEEDPEMARKIAMLPKELVDILGNMPANHRNQLLNVLPQYVSPATTASTTDREVDVQNFTSSSTSISMKMPSSPLHSKQYTQRKVITSSNYHSSLPMINKMSPKQCLSPNMHLATSQMYGPNDSDKEHLPYSMPPIPPSASLSPSSPPLSLPSLPTPSASLTKTQAICEDIKIPLILQKSTKEEKDPEIISVDDDDRQSSMNDPENKTIDLTKDNVSPINNDLIKLAEDLIKPTLSVPQDVTNYTAIMNTNKQRSVSDKTASLRAVRIKTQFERNKPVSTEMQLFTKTIIESETQTLSTPVLQPEREMFKKTTAEAEIKAVIKTVTASSAIVIDPDDEAGKLPELKKSLAIQQAEISSTQHASKTISAECKFPTSAIPSESETSQRISPQTEEIVIKEDEDLVQTDIPTSKSGVVTSTIMVQNTTIKSSNEINIAQESRDLNVSFANETLSTTDKSRHLNNVSDLNIKYAANQSFTINQDSSNKIGSNLVSDTLLKDNVTEDEESDDNVSLAVIVQQKQRNQRKSIPKLDENSAALVQKLNKNDEKNILKNVTYKPVETVDESYHSRHFDDITAKAESIGDDQITTEMLDKNSDIQTNKDNENIQRPKINKKCVNASKSKQLLTENIIVGVKNADETSKVIGGVPAKQKIRHHSEIIKDNTNSEKSEPVEVENNETIDNEKLLEAKANVNSKIAVQNRNKLQDIPIDVNLDDSDTSLNTKILSKSKKKKDNMKTSRHNIRLKSSVSVESTEEQLRVETVDDNIDNDVNDAHEILVQEESCVSENSFRLVANSNKKSKKKLRTKKSKNIDAYEASLVEERLDSEIEVNITTPLRRSRRGKSLFLDSKVDATEAVALSEMITEHKTPLTKKQLIFSKILHDEENNSHPQAHSTPEKDLVENEKVIPLDTGTIITDTTLHTSDVEQNYERDTNKVTKRKKSLQDKRKKIKSTDNSINNDINADIELTHQDFSSAPLLESVIIDVGSIPLPASKKEDIRRITKADQDEISTKEKEQLIENSDKRKSTEKRKLDDPTTSELQSTNPKKNKLKYKDEQAKSPDDNTQKVNEKHNLKPPMNSESRITCYMPARRTRSKSAIVKSSTTDIYDPYDINLEDDMIEKEAFGRKRFTSDKHSYKDEFGKRAYHHKKSYCKMSNQSRTPSTHTVVSKSSKPIFYTDKIMEMPPSGSKNFVVSDSDDSSKSDVPLKRYVEEKEKRMLESEDSSDDLNEDDTDIDPSDQSNDMEFYQGKKRRRTLTTYFNNRNKSSTQSETDEQLRSEQFMASFGFFSERIPRKSNLLASKKISETFHIIANEGDDVYVGYKERAIKRSLQNENKRRRLRAQELSASKKSVKRGRIKKAFTRPLPTYCGICKREFRRHDNFLRHQMTLFHVSKLLEIEMKVKTIPLYEEPNYLVAYKRQIDKLKILTNKLAKMKNSQAQKIKLPTMEEILENVNKSMREQQLSQRVQLSRDEALFLDCCELLKSHNNDAGTSKTPANPVDNTNKYTCATETTVKEYDLLEKPIKGDGDVDSITAKNILESEEVRNLENDLISGLKEAANASSLKTKVPYQRSVSDVGLFEDIRMSYSNPNADESYVQMESYGTANEPVQSKGKKHSEVKDKMYPDVVDGIDIFEDKFDKIKRKCRSQAAAAKHIPIPMEPSTRRKGRKKSEKKKGKRGSKKNHPSTQVLTKGALKGFEGIKVSIPTSDINMSTIIVPIESSLKKKKKSSSKKKRNKRDSESSGKYDSDLHGKITLSPQKNVDVYEFMDNDDAELFEFRPSTLMERFKSISHKETTNTSKCHPVVDEVENTSGSVSDGDDFVYMSDDYMCSDDETENSLMSCEVSSKVGSEVKKSPLKRKDTFEKNAVMGKIFKHNAVRSEKKNTKLKESAKPKANLDQLFDSLLEDEPSTSILKNNAESPQNDEFVTSEKYDRSLKYNCSTPNRDEFPTPTKFSTTSRKRYSTSPPREYDNSSIESVPSTSKNQEELNTTIDYGPSTSKKHDTMPKDYRSLSPKKHETTSSKRHDVTSKSTSKHRDPLPFKNDDISHKTHEAKCKPSKEKSLMKLDEGISTSYDYSAEVYDQISAGDDMGVARQRARRKCTVGKQNVLAETWSSESEPDGGPPRPNSAESVVLGSGRRKKGKKKDGQPSGGRRANSRQIAFKKHDVEAGRGICSNSDGGNRGGGHSAYGDSDDGLGAYDVAGPPAPAPPAPPAPPPPPAPPAPRARASAYCWSSEGDDEQEHLQQHGWIVGDSHKKLVTMLAHAKGRKRNNDVKRHLVE